ncbi:hydantoinase B/oxoprolinase family protein [Nocardia sp. NPDC019395]|uniref:hydantoinase B/oxoprolinase family protein n=1 Tax=Nocardia sp. NPDC019395 TaxID=3154686 RepID=UPI0033E5FC00
MTGIDVTRVTEDGILRHPQAQLDPAYGGPWDGKRLAYAPADPFEGTPYLDLHGEFDTAIDPITYQVLRSRFWFLNLDHGEIIQRVSGSFAVVSTMDFAVSLLTETADIVTVGPSLQYFSTLSDLVVRWTMENRSRGGITDGDVFMQNDPYVGCAQQSDSAMYAPVFWDGKLFCWIYNAMHVGDLGGIDPGGWSMNARDIYDEGLVLPPAIVARNWEFEQDIVDLFARSGRDPGMITLNLRAQLAGLRSTHKRVVELLERYGPRTVKGVMRRMIADTSRVVSERLKSIPDGRWSERLQVVGLEGDGRTIAPEVLTLSKRGDELMCTNEGTAPQSGWGNATYGVLRANVIAALNAALAYDQLGCMAGVANHVVFAPVPGTRNAANHPAAVSGIFSSMLGGNLAGLVVSKMVMSGPDELRSHANGSGGLASPMGDFLIGFNADGSLVSVDAGSQGTGVMIGCIGAFPHRDGIDAGSAWWTLGTTAGNVEEGEATGVGLVMARQENVDSGGPGRWRGGNGALSVYITHKVAVGVAQLAYCDPSSSVSDGLGGGYSGISTQAYHVTEGRYGKFLEQGRVPRDMREIEAGGGKPELMHPRAVVPNLAPGDAIVVRYNGGGGFGDPLDREPQRVADDIRDGHVSAAAARLHWGVVLEESGELDPAATTRRRAEIRERRRARARVPDGSRPVRLPDAEILVRGAAGNVDVVRGDDGPLWACSACRTGLGPADGNFKSSAARIEAPGHEVDAAMYPDPARFGDPDLLLRQYVCPDCATLLAQEFCHHDDEPYWDYRITGQLPVVGGRQ